MSHSAMRSRSSRPPRRGGSQDGASLIVTIALVFRAVMGGRELLPGLLEAGDDLTDDLRELALESRP